MKKVLIIFGILILALVGYFTYQSYSGKPKTPNISESFTDKGFSISGLGKSIDTEYVSDPMNSDFGVAIYPNSQPAANVQSAGKVDIGGEKALIGTFRTSDSLAKVVTFYTKQMGSQAVTGDVESNGVTYKIIKNQNNQGTVISVYTQDNSTLFILVKPIKT
ncbi:MAG: hypothetical protein NTZ65_03950 [Candidatus Berkelbacteria bacterium]|nr:hypothetical protein [Candidatus Berkelbacteria bacterium]